MEKMTDQEKVVYILKESGLNNTQFCAKVGVNAATLSGIITGRTKPTITFLRSVIDAFPNYNPSWIFMDQGEPLLDTEQQAQSAPGSEGVPFLPIGNSSEEDVVFDFGPLGESAMMGKTSADSASSNAASSQHATTPATPHTSPSASPASATTGSHSASSAAAPSRSEMPSRRAYSAPHEAPTVAAVDVDKIALGVASHLQKPQRKVTEIRIFFDDGTFEIFGPHA